MPGGPVRQQPVAEELALPNEDAITRLIGKRRLLAAVGFRRAGRGPGAKLQGSRASMRMIG